MKTHLKFIVLFATFFVLMPSTNPVYAYLDPGTGSMIVQAIIAAVAAVSVSIGIFWRRLRSFCSKFFKSKNKKGNDLNDN